MKRAFTGLVAVSVLGLAAGYGMGVPWFGDVTGLTTPDPLAWWVPTALGSYVWAMFLGFQIAGVINVWKEHRDRRG